MTNDSNDSEYFLARKTSQEYRSKGYEVSLDPVLDFFPGFRADLLVQKGDEVKVIEVKSRSSLAADPRISQLARFIDSKPGWSFELLLVGEPEKLDSPEGARSFEGENILRRIKKAQESLEAGLPEAAFLLAWSACEAALRELLAEQGVSNRNITTPGYVLDQAVFHGVISRDDYNHLTSMRKYRNAIVHGFELGDFNTRLVTELVEIIRRITMSASQGDAESDDLSGS